ncbi:MAG: pyridoxal phosphate-dependent aminotransferase [Selenomonadaceae bacterium]|nr:pyridoxal phosphate-dependent aminotransferase [Selenomonadaceae bacterium]
MPKLNSLITEIPEATSIAINQIVADKKNRNERVYVYSLGEAFFDIPRFEITNDEWNNGYHYCDSLGDYSLREKISELYSKRYGVEVNPKNEILISAGSKAIILMLLKTILNPGEEVIFQEPAWLSYKEQIKLVGGVCIPIEYDRDVRDFENYITPKTKAIIINNPNNPSGKIFSIGEMKILLNLAEKYDLFILSDEAYSDFVPSPKDFISFASLDTNKNHTLTVNSLSKNMGLSGWRIGYAIANHEVIKQLLKLNQHLITCAATILQKYIAKHFWQILEVTLPQAQSMALKRLEVQKILNELGIKEIEGGGGQWYILFFDRCFKV